MSVSGWRWFQTAMLLVLPTLVACDETVAASGPVADTVAALDADTASYDVVPVSYDSGAAPDGCTSSDSSDGKQVAASCPLDPPDWFVGKPTPPPTLQIDVGDFDAATGQFKPWVPGQWALIHQGSRMGFSVWPALSVQLPGETADKVILDTDVDGLSGCTVASKDFQHATMFYALPGHPGQYVDTSGGTCIWLKMTWAGVEDLCGTWMTVRARARKPNSQTWGEMTRVVRLFGEGI